jgi:hypothetical protein
MTGPKKRPVSNVRERGLQREIPNAAAVPAKTDTHVVNVAIFKLVTSVNFQEAS